MVTFKQKKITPTKIATKKSARSRKKIVKKRKFSKYLLRFLIIFVLFSSIFLAVAGFILYEKILKPLPPITNLKHISIPQTTTILDREGNLLYNVYKEKRTYIEFDKIHKNMINAIVAGEDKRFWTNPGFDLIGLIRAGLEGIKNGERPKGTSTISQQLIKNTFLTNEVKIERKIKEIYLSYQMTNEFTKQKIIELYLNKIFFGNNAYGIEQAAQTYFHKKANDLGILESSILASLPKSPTGLSPYSHADKLLGYMYTYGVDSLEGINSKEGAKNTVKILSKKDTQTYGKGILEFKKLINNIQLKPIEEKGDNTLICGIKQKDFKGFVQTDANGCVVLQYSKLLNFLNDIRIKVGDNYFEYQTGRKDFILGRMLEDRYITFKEYQKALTQSIAFEFKKSKERIKYPHFIFYVKEYLEEKYGEQVMAEGGLRIITTLDPKIQDASQATVLKYAKINFKKYGADNAASITIDNKKGEILAMVGGKDYYDKENSGQNNIITSKLQPGSTFKPFVYALAMEKNQIGPKTPVFDVKTKFPGGYSPNNFDGKFMKKMSIEKALNHSRNIPAIKMYFLAGEEKSVIKFMKDLGVKSYYEFKKYYRKKYGRPYNYGAPMALGTGEMTPLELAGAYSTIASMGERKDITPILKIYDSKGNLIYDREREQIKIINAISSETAYLITSILTNTKARPAYWNKFMALPGRIVAAKTGTSTKQFKKNGVKKIFPQNLWTVGYTPEYTTVAWVGNTNGKELFYSGNGLEGAGPIWREIMINIHKGIKSTKWDRPKAIKQVGISKQSGLLISSGTPKSDKITGEFINAPTKFDNSYFAQKVDILCNGKVTDKTPEDAIKNVFGLRYHSLRPDVPAWENPVRRLYGFGNSKVTNKVCERSDKASEMQLGINIGNGGTVIEGANFVMLGYRSTNPIVKIIIILDGRQVASYPIKGTLEGVYKGAFNAPNGLTGKKTLTVKAIDNQYYSQTISKTVILGGKDKKPPVIGLKNPSSGNINLNAGNPFNLRASITDLSPIRAVNIYLDGKSIASGIKTRNIVQSINTTGLSKGTHTLKIDATDMHFNTAVKFVTITILDGKKKEEKKSEKTLDSTENSKDTNKNKNKENKNKEEKNKEEKNKKE